MTTILTPTAGGGGAITTIAQLNNVIVQADNAGRGPRATSPPAPMRSIWAPAPISR